jgi:hypothetical protein
VNGPASGMSTVDYAAAVLVAADRNERRAWAEHKIRLELGVVAGGRSGQPVPATSPTQALLDRVRGDSS